MGLTKREIGCPVTAAAESKFSYRTIANQSRCELYAAIRHLFKDVEPTFYGKTGLPGRVVRHAVLDETGGVIYGPSG